MASELEYSHALSSFIRRIDRLGPSAGNLVVSAVGGFIFSRSLRLIAMDKERSDAWLSIRPDAGSPKTPVGIDAVVFLLAFNASEVLATIGALRH